MPCFHKRLTGYNLKSQKKSNLEWGASLHLLKPAQITAHHTQACSHHFAWLDRHLQIRHPSTNCLDKRFTEHPFPKGNGCKAGTKLLSQPPLLTSNLNHIGISIGSNSGGNWQEGKKGCAERGKGDLVWLTRRWHFFNCQKDSEWELDILHRCH